MNTSLKGDYQIGITSIFSLTPHLPILITHDDKGYTYIYTKINKI